MKLKWKYLFPGLFGLLIYATIRVVNDTVGEFKFWTRDWRQNAFEVVFCTLVTYLMLYVFKLIFRRFDREMQQSFQYKTMVRELFWVIVIVVLINNATIIPMAALTDDGLSWGDVAVINTIPLLYCLIYYIVIRSQKLLRAYVDNKLQLEKISKDHLQTELKFLKAQYHPHFLFNALNTIYFQMDESVPAAKKSVEKFSELLRYQLYDQQHTVPVSQEIHYLQNFIELQQTRSSEKLQLDVRFDPSLNGQQVYPLLFLPLVENAFKYVGGDYKIHIEAAKDGNSIHFKVTNSVPEQALPQKSGGIGLENLQRRLELLYPGKHAFKAEKKGNSFFTDLSIEV
jgi:two-component system, LytTR family, sensor kinase